MSACGEFAEHVWKPGSCKNCFHPRSAHAQTGTAGIIRSSLTAEDEDGLTSPSPYSKPTIAVRPTMMNMDIAMDINMNMEQENQKSSIGLRKALHLAPLFIDSGGCNRTVMQNGVSGKKEYPDKFPQSICSPTGLSKDCMIINNIFVSQENGCGPHNWRDGDPYRPPAPTIKSTYANGDSCLHQMTERTLSIGNNDGLMSPLRSSIEERQTPLGVTQGKRVNRTSNVTHSTSPSSTVTQDFHENLSDSCLDPSSTGSLKGLPSPQNSPDSASVPPNGLEESEPIYAESTKRKRRDGKSPQSTESELEVNINESQRATITVIAAHTEENNLTFYLSSPDSAVSTQWTHFSPTAPKDVSSTAFTWPNVPETTETFPVPCNQPKPQSSPPVPPKINTRSPRLGTSSLCLLPLPELSFHLVLPPKDMTPAPSQEINHPPGPAYAHSERRLKPQSARSLEGCIDEVEEEVEPEEGTTQRAGSCGRPGDFINGPAVWGCESKEWSEGRASPGTNTNKSTSQMQTGVPAEDNRVSESTLTRVVSSPSPLDNSTELNTEKAASRDPVPPPPPPKKHHRVCNRLSGSNMDLERSSQPGSVENLCQSMRGLNCCTNASTNSLQALSDADSTFCSCPSPFPSSPLASAPVSPQPDVFPSNSLAHQLQPPPLPQKKLVNRTTTVLSESGVKLLVRGRPRLPFSCSESNVSHPDAAGPLRSHPSSPVEPRPLYSSSESLEYCPPLCSRTLDEPSSEVTRRLRGHSRGSITSSSSPQLNTLLSTPPAVGSTLQLHTLLSNMDSREGIYSKLGGLYAESLRRLALKCEEHFTRSQRSPLRFDESNWSLFKLTCNKPSCLSGDAVYYSASCASDSHYTYAVKICKGQSADRNQGHLYGLSVQQNLPAHFNLQQDCGHFIACVPQSMLPGEQSSSSAPGPSEQERVVVITREVPHQSAADFAKEWESFHKAQPEVYERRVCFLLLQLCTGLEHLKSHGVTHRDLCLENLLLVQHRRSPAENGTSPDPQQQCLPRLLISNFCKAKRRNAGHATVCADPRLTRDHARLAPEIVSAAQYRKFDEFQTGILIYELLHQSNPFEATPALRQQEYKCDDLPPIPSVSIYSAGLERLAHLLLEPDPGKRIHIQDAKRVLQGLLWGPRRDLLEQPWVSAGAARRVEQPRHEGLLNWLDVKRALLMMKFAERSLEPERNAELEDWLCCQYFSLANPKSLCQAAELLYNVRFSH
ncbi:LOW QUALITY PROTEIN: inactive tyrosine-protein kinase PRAG1-like [Xyrauchen texanus]|uniref:LOW QUALITY PROTEIN: inactive tyrosine-protein kinase PRAG1-like n=1 Tax=Xyrauchen texanus TaxID=154827 RepID=UPI002241DF7D|nr:LOW QUALITY PROTEIN: inactive tyrosine-protein kinase PRAG1-like [Xyrauchen texanus]